jgi:hypothetical protein
LLSHGSVFHDTQVRISKKSGAIMPKPEFKRARPKNIVAGPLDTRAEDVLEVTYEPVIGPPFSSSRVVEPLA